LPSAGGNSSDAARCAYANNHSSVIAHHTAASATDSSSSSSSSANVPSHSSHNQQHVFVFSRASEIHSNTYHLLTCDTLICCYLPHQKSQMITLLKDRVLNVLHEATPIVLWEMDVNKDQQLDTSQDMINLKNPINVLTEETPRTKRKIILLKGGTFLEFHRDLVDTKYLFKFAMEKKQHQRGLNSHVLDKRLYEEIEKKVLRARKGMFHGTSTTQRTLSVPHADSDSDISSEDSADDVAQCEVSDVRSLASHKLTESALNKLIEEEDESSTEALPTMPPPPPMVSGGAPPPPPPPLMGGKLAPAHNGIKLKKFHWKNIDLHFLNESIWKETPDQSVKLSDDDVKQLEALFSIQKAKTPTSETPHPNKQNAESICLVGVTRSRNIEIVLRGLSRALQHCGQIQHESHVQGEEDHKPDLSQNFPTFVHIVEQMDPDSVLSVEDCESLLRCLPVAADIKSLKKYEKMTKELDGKAPNITAGDQWLLYSMQHAPLMYERLTILSHMHTFPDTVRETRRMIQIHAEAQKQLLQCETLKKVLLLVREVGCVLNRGQMEGMFQGFILESLGKMRELRSTGRKHYCLLQLIWDWALERDIPIKNLLQELSSVSQASEISHELIDKQVQAVCSTARCVQSISEETLQLPQVAQFRASVMEQVEECVKFAGDTKSEYQLCMQHFAQKFSDGESLFEWVAAFLTALRDVTQQKCCKTR